jgi:L,D-peptidoglycan transpeptidase YkuD (ErfK/YbiS/YcfS/YnhG family)
MRRFVAVLILGLTVIGVPASAAVPGYFPTRLAHLGDARQVIVVTGSSRTSTYATLRTYELGTDGAWRQTFAPMAARSGYGGWVAAGKRVQDTGKTPAGTFRITEAFGIKANPGTRLRYRKVDGNDYWVGDRRDPYTYNLFEPAATAKRTWRTAEAERLAAYPTQYAYAAVIDFNRPVASSVHFNAAHQEYVTSQHSVIGRGSAVFLHVNGKGSTAGCVSVSSANLVKVLRWLDPAKKPRIVMAALADIGQA